MQSLISSDILSRAKLTDFDAALNNISTPTVYFSGASALGFRRIGQRQGKDMNIPCLPWEITATGSRTVGRATAGLPATATESDTADTRAMAMDSLHTAYREVAGKEMATEVDDATVEEGDEKGEVGERNMRDDVAIMRLEN